MSDVHLVGYLNATIMISKEKLLLVIKNMPDEFSVEELMEKALLLNKIEIGLKQAKDGEIYSTEVAKRMIREWSK